MAKRYTVAELVVKVKADIKQMRIGLGQGLSEVKAFGSDVGKASHDLSRMGRGLGIISGAMVGIGYAAVRVFAQLEQAIANTASVTGDTTEGVKDLEKFARKMGKTTIFTATQAGDAMYYLASAGYSAKEIFSGLEGILALAAATQYDLAETTATVVSTLRAYSLEADQAARLSNVFAAAISSSQATMFKLQESMKYVAPVAANLNYTIEDTVAALSLLYNSGLEASMSGTQLRMSLMRLQRPTKAAVRAMGDLGVKVENMNPAFNDIVDIISELENANAGAAKSGRAMAEIFGVRAVNAMNILVGNGSAALELMTDKITGTSKATEMQQRQINTLKGTWRLMTSALQETSIIIGTTLQPALKAIMEAVRQLNLWFSAMPSVMQKVVVGGGSLIAIFTGIGGVLLLLLAQLPKLTKLTKAAGVGWKLMGARIFWVITAITALLAATTWLISAQEREKRLRKTLILDYSNYLNKREQDLKLTIHLAERLNDLTDVAADNITKLRQRERAIKKMNDLYPGLIDNEKSLAEQIDKIGEVALESSDALDRLIESKEELRELKIATDLQDVRNVIKDIEEDLRTIDLGERFTEFFSKGVLSSKEAKEAFKKDLESIDKNFAEVAADMGALGESAMVEWHPNLIAIRKELQKIVTSENGIKKIIAIQDGLRLKVLHREADYQKELDKTNMLGQIGANFSKTTLNQKEATFNALLSIRKVTDETLKKAKALAEARAEEAGYLLEQKKITKDIEDISTPRRSREEIAQEMAIENRKFTILTAAMTDRVNLREETLTHEYDIMKLKLEQENFSKREAETELANWLRRKKLENKRKTEEEVTALEMAIVSKGNANVFAIRIKEIERWKVKALREAEALHTDKNAIIQAYEKELTKIQEEEENTRLKLITNIAQQIGAAKLESIEDISEKEIKEEKLKWERDLNSADEYYKEWKIKVKEGLMSKSEADKAHQDKTEAANKAHELRLTNLQRDQNIERKRLSEELAITKMKAMADINITEPMEYEIAQEIIAFRERKINLGKWLDEKNELIEQKKADQVEIDESYDAQSDALFAEHEANKNAIRLAYAMLEKEQKMAVVDEDTIMYDEMLGNYIDFLKSKLDSLKGNMEEYKALIDLINALESKQLDRTKDKHKKTADFIGGTWSLVGEAIGASGQGATAAWKDSLSSFVKMAAAERRAWALENLATSWGNPIGMIKWSAALVAISAAEQVALGRIAAAQYGAEVKKTGLLNVHEGETIVPANLNNIHYQQPIATIERKSWSQYAANMVAGMNLPTNIAKPIPAMAATAQEPREIKVVMEWNINAEGTILSPADDEQADIFYERFIMPAEERFREVMQSTINEG